MSTFLAVCKVPSEEDMSMRPRIPFGFDMNAPVATGGGMAPVVPGVVTFCAPDGYEIVDLGWNGTTDPSVAVQVYQGNTTKEVKKRNTRWERKIQFADHAGRCTVSAQTISVNA